MWFHWVWLHGSRRSRPLPALPPLNPSRHRRPWIRHTPAPPPPFFFFLSIFLSLPSVAQRRHASLPTQLLHLWLFSHPCFHPLFLALPASVAGQMERHARAHRRTRTHGRLRRGPALSLLCSGEVLPPLPPALQASFALCATQTHRRSLLLAPRLHFPAHFLFGGSRTETDRTVQLRGKQQQEKQSAGRRLEGWSLSRK